MILLFYMLSKFDLKNQLWFFQPAESFKMCFLIIKVSKNMFEGYFTISCWEHDSKFSYIPFYAQKQNDLNITHHQVIHQVLYWIQHLHVENFDRNVQQVLYFQVNYMKTNSKNAYDDQWLSQAHLTFLFVPCELIKGSSTLFKFRFPLRP